jgi:hypothetical protein
LVRFIVSGNSSGRRMDVATWNVLHDGQIIDIKGELPGDLTLTIEVAYLCRRLRTAAEHLALALKDCRQFEYCPYERDATYVSHLQAAIGLEILSAATAMGQLSIECADGGAGGQLLVDYGLAYVFTAEGELQSQPVLERASDEYWDDWEKRRSKN